MSAGPATAAGFDTIIVGAGIFGVSAAVELAGRGQRVALCDPGPIPHPDAASSDISKVVRLEYGADRGYMALMERARDGWLRWNEQLFGELAGGPLYHETGIAMLTSGAMAPGGFEHDSFASLIARGHAPERLGPGEIVRRFPAWRPGFFTDGFYHARGGYAESGAVVAALARRARELGVAVREGVVVVDLTTAGDGVSGRGDARVTGVVTRDGERWAADTVIVAAGPRTPRLVPDLASQLRATGHPIIHLVPPSHDSVARRFQPPEFCVFTGDIARTGWYGFPIHPGDRSAPAGALKIANHGVGLGLEPDLIDFAPRTLVGDRGAGDIAAARAFLRDALPDLADAAISFTRRCVYCDTLDGHFLIDRHPGRPGLVVATGGSGHGFKFAPVLGRLIADAVLGETGAGLDEPLVEALDAVRGRFRWRVLDPATVSEEAARKKGESDANGD